MTTSDTLNNILSNDMADFIDSLLYDCGLDIFDKKGESYKLYLKKVNEKPRVFCDIDATKNANNVLLLEIKDHEDNIEDITNNKLLDNSLRIEKGHEYIDSLRKKMFKIDDEIYSLNIDDVNIKINEGRRVINELNSKINQLNNTLSTLKQSYDVDRYNELIGRRDEHKNIVYEYRLSIKNIERQIQEIEHKIEIIRGNIFQLKKEKSRLEQEIVELTNSKICPSCGQPKTKEHIGHVNEVIVKKNNEINDILEKIVVFENNDIGIHNNTITEYRNKIVTINKSIDDSNIQMENVLSEIGKLTNDKNDVEK